MVVFGVPLYTYYPKNNNLEPLSLGQGSWIFIGEMEWRAWLNG